MKHKLWLRISAVVLSLFMLEWLRESFAMQENILILTYGIGMIISLIFIFLVLFPVHYYAWKKPRSDVSTRTISDTEGLEDRKNQQRKNKEKVGKVIYCK